MPEIDIIEQKPVTMAEVRSFLDNAKKDSGELNFRVQKVSEYLKEFAGKKTHKELYTKIESLGISKLRDRHITKIIDMMPADADSLKIIFAGDVVSLKQDELQKIVEAIND